MISLDFVLTRANQIENNYSFGILDTILDRILALGQRLIEKDWKWAVSALTLDSNATIKAVYSAILLVPCPIKRPTVLTVFAPSLMTTPMAAGPGFPEQPPSVKISTFIY